MDERLSLTQVLLLITYAIALGGGNFFKLAATKLPTVGSLSERLLALTYNGFFVAAVTLYAALAVFWVWILSFTPLSRAYIFVALAFAITPFAGVFVFGEPLSVRLVLGIGFIFLGLVCAAG